MTRTLKDSRKLLSNMRLVCVPSDSRGEDWYEKTTLIDESLHLWGMDLAEESVYLFFDRAPGALLEGEDGECLIARSVIGPKKKLPLPFFLRDWTSSRVYSRGLSENSWSSLFSESFSFWGDLQREGKKILPAHTVRIRRSLNPGLGLNLEVIFRE
jgi:hypothetical protein